VALVPAAAVDTLAAAVDTLAVAVDIGKQRNRST
jgi:hypothetical protein